MQFLTTKFIDFAVECEQQTANDSQKSNGFQNHVQEYVQILLQLISYTFSEPLTWNCPNIPREMEFVRCPLLIWTFLFGHYFTVPWAPSSLAIAFPPLLPILSSNCLHWISSVQGGERTQNSSIRCSYSTMLRTGQCRNWGLAAGSHKGFFAFPRHSDELWSPPSRLANGYRTYIPEVRRLGFQAGNLPTPTAVTDNTCSYKYPSPQYVSTQCCSIKHRDTFTFT